MLFLSPEKGSGKGVQTDYRELLRNVTQFGNNTKTQEITRHSGNESFRMKRTKHVFIRASFFTYIKRKK